MMSKLRFLTIHLLLLLLLLAAGCEAQDYGFPTLPPDYENDYNATFDYSFFSNSSSEDLYRFIGEVEGEEEEEVVVEEEVSATTETTSRKTTEMIKTGRGGSRGAAADNSASLPVSLVTGKLLWTSLILMVLDLQQL